jgi:hypothetical protein
MCVTTEWLTTLQRDKTEKRRGRDGAAAAARVENKIGVEGRQGSEKEEEIRRLGEARSRSRDSMRQKTKDSCSSSPQNGAGSL